MRTMESHNIFAIQVGNYFHHTPASCYLVYAPLNNKFFLALPQEVQSLREQLASGNPGQILQSLLKADPIDKEEEVSTDTFCTLHLLLNEKCNFHCKYCYSASGRSKAELDISTIETMLRFFLSHERNAPKTRTVMFMGGGEPVLSWDLLKESTLLAEKIAEEQKVKALFSLTTNGSIMSPEMMDFLKLHKFTVQISFEVLPDVQISQRGPYDAVAQNVRHLSELGIDHYVRSTITALNVDRISEMVEHCHREFPLVKKLSCQQVVDTEYFTNTDVVDDFFNRYYHSFKEAQKLAERYGITLRSSSSHLLNYSHRERFCYNLVCLTPYGTLTTCPDVSSPLETYYPDAIFAKMDKDKIVFDQQAFARLSTGSIHTYEKCRECFARWNCGSGCPSSRRVYSEKIFDAICNYYRRMLATSLIEELANKYKASTGADLYAEIEKKLAR